MGLHKRGFVGAALCECLLSMQIVVVRLPALTRNFDLRILTYTIGRDVRADQIRVEYFLLLSQSV